MGRYEKISRRNAGIRLENLDKAWERWEKAYKRAEQKHESAVRKALSSGKPVPLEVLKDYPDLAAEYEKRVDNYEMVRRESNGAVSYVPVKKKEKVPPDSQAPAALSDPGWDALDEDMRLTLATDAGWAKKTAKKFAKTKWADLSPAAQRVISQRFEKAKKRVAGERKEEEQPAKPAIEMTRDEFLAAPPAYIEFPDNMAPFGIAKARLRNGTYSWGNGKNKQGDLVRTINVTPEELHEKLVHDAIVSGTPVSEEVLKDYPNLIDLKKARGAAEREKQEEEPAATPPEKEEAAPAPAPAPAAKPAYGADNKLVTQDRAEEIRKRLREKLDQLNVGIDPEMMSLGAELAVFHIEAGARSFIKYAKAVIDDLGIKAKPFLKSWYMGARYYPGMNTEGMDTPATMDAINLDDLFPEGEGEAAVPSTKDVELPQPKEEEPEAPTKQQPATWLKFGELANQAYVNADKTGKTTSLAPRADFIRAAADELGVSMGDIKRGLSVFNSADPVDAAKTINKPVPKVLGRSPAESPAAAEQKGNKLLGKNSEGQDVYEDKNGVRYIIQDGVKSTEPVAVIPSRGGEPLTEPAKPRRSEFLVEGEAEKTGDEWTISYGSTQVGTARVGTPIEAVPTPEVTFYDDLRERLLADPALRNAAKNSDEKAFKVEFQRQFKKHLIDAFTERLPADNDIARAYDTLMEYPWGYRDFYDSFLDDIKKATPGAPEARTLADYGLKIKATQTNKGNPVWEVSGDTRQHKDVLKSLGGRWYGPKKTWSFFKSDPTAKLLAALGGTKAESSLQTSETPGIITPKKEDKTDERLPGAGTSIHGGTPEAGSAPPQAGGQVGVVPGRPGERGPGHGERDDGKHGEGTAVTGGLPGKNAGAQPPRDDSPRSGAGGTPGVSPVPVNFKIQPDTLVSKAGWKQKAKDNIAAIRTLKQIQAENRYATPEEQSILVKYVGWGASELANNMFPTGSRLNVWSAGWNELGQELKDLLSPEEYAGARASTPNAHYTSPEVIRGMYEALARMGFQGGRILEPGSGVGHFVGLLPDTMAANSRFTGVEMDPVSAAIGKLLYPKEDMRHGDYTKTTLPDGFFDVVIGNPPFEDTVITADRRYAKHRFALHDYFFAKSMDKLRPGGLMVLVTSRYTMDKANDNLRDYLSERGDFLGAIRLPQTAFKENAGTEVVTDVIFMRKRDEGEERGGKSWSGLVEITTPQGKTHINEYFVANPEMVLGRHALTGSMYGPGQYTVEPVKDMAIGDQFKEASKVFPEGIYKKEKTDSVADRPTGAEHEMAPSAIKEGAYYIGKDGTLLVNEDGAGVPVKKQPKAERIIRSYISVRDAARQVLYVQLKSDGTGEELAQAQAALSKAYDAFVKEHGHIGIRRVFETKNGTSTRYPNIEYFRLDPDAYFVAALETFDEETETFGKAAIFTERVIRPTVKPDIKTAADALFWTIYDAGKIDIAVIAEHLGMSEAQTLAELSGLIYLNPDRQTWETADEYLSGNVREKLKMAESAAASDPQYKANVEALEAVQPEDLPPSKIKVGLGMPVVRPAFIADFAREVLDLGKVKVEYIAAIGKWDVADRHGGLPVHVRSYAATTEYGTEDRHAAHLLVAALNNQQVQVTRLDDEGKRYVDKKATEAANEKLQKIKERFVSWIWEEGKRAEVFARDYNDQLNAVVKRTYDGPQLDVMTFPGMSAAIRPYRHQKRVAYRIVQNGNTYMAHGVGAGKTIASIMAGMEMKRLGIKKKPMWVVPNHMLKQFSTEFLQLYPAAKILVADEVNFAKQLRNRFMGRVAAENWDGIIITHSAFGLMPMDPDYSAAYIQEQIEELESILQGSRGDRLKRKQIERAKKRLQQRLDKLLAAKNKDKGVTFEESGIDMLFVDEAQEFRKLDFVTEMGQIKGIDSQGSARAHDLFMKTRYLEDLSPGRSLVMMSGTPITNTIGEVYTIQRFLQDEELRRHGLHHFDSWASTFGEMKTQIEATPGGYKAISRFARFRNIATLSKMWGEVGDYVKTSDVPGLVLPTVKTGNRVIVATPQSALQVAYKAELRERVRQIEARGRPPQKGDDIILTVITDGRHAAIDERYIDPRQKPNPESKLEKMTNKVFEIWERTKEDRLTQMIFSDIGVPGSEERRGFSAYKRIKERLIELGVPEKEIAFMQDYKKSDDKYKLFQKMNRGEIRVLIGSSQAMGTGVNAQKKLVALHHLDPDNYLPAWIEQREGRIVRQNNTNEMVELYAYVAEGSYDEQMWQFLESKQLFIDEFMRGDATDSEVDDIDGAANSYATAKAMASDNPLWLEKAALENEIAKLELLKRAHTDEQVGLRQRYAFAKSDLAHHEETVEKLKAIIKALPDMSGDKFSIVIGKNTFNDRKSAGEELAKIVWKNAEKLAIGEHTNNTVIGSYAGMPLSASILASESWHSQRFTGGKADELERRIRYELSIRLTTSDNAYTVASSGDIEKDKDPIGLIARIENLLGQFEQRRARSEERAAEHAKFIKDAQEKINSPFAHQASLDSKLTRIEEINKELTAEEGMSPGGVGDLVVDEDAQDVDLERRQPVGESEAILTGRDVGPLLHSLSKRVKGLEVARDEGGNYYIKTRGKKTVMVKAVKALGQDRVALDLYDQTHQAGTAPTGGYSSGVDKRQPWRQGQRTIFLVKGKAGMWTLTHEFYHFLEDAGVISAMDREILTRHIRALVKKGRFETRNQDDIGGDEDRAYFAESRLAGEPYDVKSPVGRIIEAIREIIDTILNAVGIRTARGVMRDIRTGKVHDRAEAAEREGKGTQLRVEGPSTGDAAYLDAVRRGDMEAAQQMVNEAIEAAGLPILDDSASESYQIRRGPPPKKTVKGYKLLVSNAPGSVSPLFVGSKDTIPMGVWLDAVPGPMGGQTKSGRPRVKSKLGLLSYRPGWHGSDIPLAIHIGIKNALGKIFARRPNEVWVEADFAADVDYQSRAGRNGLAEMPINGSYRFKTNPNMDGEWIISGSMKINRILSEKEVEGILRQQGHEPMPWHGGPLDLERLGLAPGMIRNVAKLADPVTYDDQGNVIPLSERFQESSPDIRYRLAPATSALPEHVRERWEAARGVPRRPGRAWLAEKLQALKAGTHHFPALQRIEDKKLRAALSDVLRQHQEIPQYASEVAIRRLTEWTGDLNPQQRTVYEENIILADLVRDIDSGLLTEGEGNWKEEGPFGFRSEDEIRTALDTARQMAQQDSAVAAALEKRRAFIRDLKQDLVDYKILKPEVLESEDYYHHQVLVHWGDFRGAGTGSRDVRKHWRPWMAARTGSVHDYNTQYFEAEFTAIAQQLAQVETARTLARLKDMADEYGNLKAQAKTKNKRLFYQKWNKQFGPAVPGDKDSDPLFPFRSRIAMSMQKLGRMATNAELDYDSEFEETVTGLGEAWEFYKANKADIDDLKFDFQDARLFHFLSHLVQRGGAGSKQAATIFKAIQDRNKMIDGVLGKDKITWQQLIPEGYTEWRPDPKKGWFWANTYTDKVLQQIASGEIRPEDAEARKVLAKGRAYIWVIPEGLAETLDKFNPTGALHDEGIAARAAAKALAMWKQYILINPVRVLKYNTNNASGDADICLAYAPEILRGKYAGQAMKDLNAWHRRQHGKLDAGTREDMEKARRLGVLGSGFAVQEVEDVMKIIPDERHLRNLLLGEKLNILQRYWKNAREFTTWRENVLRLAAYRFFQDALKKGKRLYGASNPQEIDAITDLDEKAAKLARELLGDYGNISAHGQWIRKRMIPFYSWMEINAPRYVYMARNLRYEDRGEGAGKRIAKVAARRVVTGGAKFALRASLLYGAVMLYNAIFWPDEDKELGESGRQQLHLILGRREDGTIITLRFQGALSDALAWFDGEDLPQDIVDLTQGRRTIQEKLIEAAKAPVNKFVQGIRPDAKVAAEVAFGQAAFPDVFRPRPIYDTTEHILRTFSLDSPYRWLAGKPKRGDTTSGMLIEDIKKMLLYEANPGEQAYYDTRRLVNEWNAKHGKEPYSGGGRPTKKSRALYYYKQALKYGDFKAAEKYLRKYHELGGTGQGLRQSIRMAHPLAGIKQNLRYAFRKSLSPHEEETLQRGLEFYRTHYGANYQKNASVQ